MSTNARALTRALNDNLDTIALAQLLPAEAPMQPVDGVNIWLTPGARYPFTTVWAPLPRGSDEYDQADWLWGPNLEHTAPADVELAELVALVVASLPPEPTVPPIIQSLVDDGHFRSAIIEPEGEQS
jgi:hypothetical protein